MLIASCIIQSSLQVIKFKQYTLRENNGTTSLVFSRHFFFFFPYLAMCFITSYPQFFIASGLQIDVVRIHTLQYSEYLNWKGKILSSM